MTLEELNSKYNAFITFHEISPEKEGILSGLTFGIKDIFLTKGIRTTAGSRVLKDYVPKSNAYVVDQILQNGGRVIGKTNTHEFALGATNTSSIAGPARNPHDPSRISGGSSGGSAVAVALDMVDVGIGSDTGGSIRIPASLCGVIGFKPTTGLVPLDGVIPFSWSMDTVGIMSKSFDKILLTFNSLLPYDKRKVLVSQLPSKPKIGVYLFGDDQGSQSLSKVLDKISSEFEVKQVNLNMLTYFGSHVRQTIAVAEASSYHKEWINSYAGLYFDDTKNILLSGFKISAVDYVDAMRARRALLEEYLKAFRDVDVIISPTTKIVAPKIDEVKGRESQFRYQLISNTELFSVVGAPSISIPLGSGPEGLPLGLMVSGEPFEDGKLLRIASMLQDQFGSKQVS